MKILIFLMLLAGAFYLRIHINTLTAEAYLCGQVNGMSKIGKLAKIEITVTESMKHCL